MANAQIYRRMVEFRRDLHMYPETGWTEFRTTAVIAAALGCAGYEPVYGGDFIKPEFVMGRSLDLDRETERAVAQGAEPDLVKRAGRYTGLVAELDTGRPGPCSALRFDIDCVDVEESGDADRLPVRQGFLSRNRGMMHACGHDGHAAVGVALAEELMKEKERFCGRVRFIFQPAEEGVRGAYAMTKSGAVDKVDNFIAMHLGLGHPTGEVAPGVSGFLCTTKFDVDYTGVAAHAGAEPEKGRNALLAAAASALSLSALPARFSGTTRVNVGVLNAGVGRNVIAPNAHIKAETRGENPELAREIYNEAVLAVSEAAARYGVKAVVTKEGESISSESDSGLAEVISQAAGKTPGVVRVEKTAQMSGSDDACWMMEHVRRQGGRASYVIVGADTAAGHHNGSFDFDEDALGIAFDLFWHTLVLLNGTEAAAVR